MTIDPTVIIGFLGTLMTALVTVARFVYLDMRRDRDFWRTTALGAMRHTDTALEVAKNGSGDV